MEPGNEGPNDFLAGDDASDDASDGASDDGAAGESGGAEGGDASSGSQQGGGDDDAKGDGDDESIQVLTSAPELALNSSGNLSPRAIQTLSPMSALSGDEASLFHGEEDIEPSAQSKKRKRDSDLSPLDLLSDTAGRAMTPPPGSNGDASSSGNNVSSSGNSSTHNSKAPPETESHKRRRVDNGDSVEAEVEGDKEDGEDEGDDADDEDDDKDDEDLGPDVSDDLLARVYEKSHVLGACLWFADKELGAMHVGELHEVFTTLGVQPTVANISACQELMRKIRDWCTSDLRVLQRARSTTTNASQDQAASSMSDEESSTERNMPAAAVEDDVAPQESPQRKANQRFAQKKYRKFNLPFKIHVLDYYNAHGRDRQRAAKEFGVEYHTIYGWTKSEAKLRAQDARKRVRYANGGYPNSANGRYPPAPSPPIVRRSEQSREQTNGVSNAGPPPLERGSASVSKPSQQSADGASIVYNNVAANGPTAPSVSSSSTTSGPPQNSVTSAWHMHRDRKEQESDPSTSKPSAVPPVTAPAHPPLSSISPPTDTPTGASQEMTDEKLAASTAQDMYDQKVSKKYRIFNIKFKIQVLDYFHATNDDKKLAPQKFSVPYQTIYKWGRVEDKLRARHKALLAEEEHRALRAQAKLARQSMKKAREERRRLNRADELKYAQNAAASSPNAALPSSTPPQHRGLSDVLEQSSSAPTDEPSVKKRRLDPVKAEPGHGENGENGKRTPKKYKKFDDKFKIRALNWWHQNGRNRAKAAKQFGLEYHTFYAWTKQESHLRMAQLDRNPDVTIIDDVLHGAESDPSEAPSSSESEQFDSDSGASDTSVSSASYDSGPERPFPNIPRARPRLTDIGPPKSLRSPQAAEGKPFAPGFRTPGPSLASRMVMSQSGPTPPTATAPAASASSSSSSSSAAATPTPKAEAGASPALSTPSQPISAPLASNSSGKRRGRKRKAEVEAEWNSGNREHLWECPHCKGHVYKKSKSTHLKYCRHRDTSPERRGRRRTREEIEAEWAAGRRDNLWECPRCLKHIVKNMSKMHNATCPGWPAPNQTPRGRRSRADIEAAWAAGDREGLWECDVCGAHIHKAKKTSHPCQLGLPKRPRGRPIGSRTKKKFMSQSTSLDATQGSSSDIQNPKQSPDGVATIKRDADLPQKEPLSQSNAAQTPAVNTDSLSSAAAGVPTTSSSTESGITFQSPPLTPQTLSHISAPVPREETSASASMTQTRTLMAAHDVAAPGMMSPLAGASASTAGGTLLSGSLQSPQVAQQDDVKHLPVSQAPAPRLGHGLEYPPSASLNLLSRK